jgi:hypothetical protein
MRLPQSSSLLGTFRRKTSECIVTTAACTARVERASVAIVCPSGSVISAWRDTPSSCYRHRRMSKVVGNASPNRVVENDLSGPSSRGNDADGVTSTQRIDEQDRITARLAVPQRPQSRHCCRWQRETQRQQGVGRVESRRDWARSRPAAGAPSQSARRSH